MIEAFTYLQENLKFFPSNLVLLQISLELCCALGFNENDCFDKNNEVKIGKYYVDVMLDDSHIIEIQTRNFNKLREKLEFLLKDHVVTIVYPIDYIKTINWIDKDSSEVVSSSKRTNYGAFNKAFPELYKIKQYLNNDNLKIVLLLMETNENRFLDGCDKTKKRRSTKIDKYPVSVKDMLILYEKNDYKYFIKDLLNEFSVKDYKKISLFFFIGMSITVLLSLILVYLFKMETTYAMLLSLVVGFALIACLEFALTKSYFRHILFLYNNFVSHLLLSIHNYHFPY